MTSSEYSITRGVGNSRGRRKTRVVSPVIGQAGCPGREPESLREHEWESAHMYNDSNSLGDRAKEGVADMVKFKAQVIGHEATEKANRIQAWQGLSDWQLADKFDKDRPVSTPKKERKKERKMISWVPSD